MFPYHKTKQQPNLSLLLQLQQRQWRKVILFLLFFAFFCLKFLQFPETTAVEPTPTDVPAAPSKQMTVLLRVDQPDIILVEKLDDINCLALILNVSRFSSPTRRYPKQKNSFRFKTQIELRLRIQDEKQVVKGDISQLKFYICEFNPSRREATKHFILQPCDIALHGNTPEAKGMHISLTTSDIRVNISPGMCCSLHTHFNRRYTPFRLNGLFRRCLIFLYMRLCVCVCVYWFRLSVKVSPFYGV